MSWAEVKKINDDLKALFYLYSSENIIYSSGAVSVRGTGTTDAINKTMKYPGALQIQVVSDFGDNEQHNGSTITVYVNNSQVATLSVSYGAPSIYTSLSASFNKGDTLRVTVSKKTNNPVGSTVTINLLGQVGIGGAIFDE